LSWPFRRWGIHELFHPGWSQTKILLISPSQVTRLQVWATAPGPFVNSFFYFLNY
jgi:hypothetical protein